MSEESAEVNSIVELVRVVEQLRLDVDEDRALIDQLRADLAVTGQDGAKPGKRV